MKSSETRMFSGIIVAVVTPFQDNHPYENGITNLTSFLNAKEIDFLFACGTSGEGMIMSVEERKQVVEMMIEKSSKPVIVQTGTNNLDDTVDLSKHAKDAGACAVAVITPSFYPYTSDGLESYFFEISKSCDLPIFLYSNPFRANVKINLESVVRILQNGTNFIGIKESSGDMNYLGKLIDLMPTQKVVFNGADPSFLPGLVLGSAGQVSGYANVTPELYVDLYRKWEEGDIIRARHLQSKITQLRSLLETPYIQPIKEALKLRGIDVGSVKSPLIKMKEKEVESLRNSLKEICPEFFD